MKRIRIKQYIARILLMTLVWQGQQSTAYLFPTGSLSTCNPRANRLRPYYPTIWLGSPGGTQLRAKEKSFFYDLTSSIQATTPKDVYQYGVTYDRLSKITSTDQIYPDEARPELPPMLSVLAAVGEKPGLKLTVPLDPQLIYMALFANWTPDELPNTSQRVDPQSFV